jgi:hypothetical protein
MEPTPHPRFAMAGLSMVELLVAMALGLLVLAGLLQVMASSRAAYRLAETQSRVQENGRYAVQMLAGELRGARSAGCRSIAMEERQRGLNTLACDLMNPSDAQGRCAGESAIGTTQPMGYDSDQAGGWAWLAELPGNAVGGAERLVGQRWLRGDVLVVWGTVGEGVYMAANGSVDDSQQGTVDLVETREDLTGGRLAMVTDCEASDIFTITNPRTDQGSSLSLPDSLSFLVNYDPDGSPDPAAPHDPDYRDRSGEQVNRRSQLSRSYNRVGTETSPGATIRARVFPFEYQVFYVCCTRDGSVQTGNSVQRCNTDPDQYRPALCRWSTSTENESRQLVTDVVDMRVTYDGTEGGQRFLDLTESPDAAWVLGRRGGQGAWDAVDTVRVELLVTNGDQVLDKATQPPLLNALPVGAGVPDDRRLYTRFEVSVATRSSSPWYVKP